jgi:hypothetical protein
MARPRASPPVGLPATQVKEKTPLARGQDGVSVAGLVADTVLVGRKACAPQLVSTAGATPDRPSIEWRRGELRREAAIGR